MEFDGDSALVARSRYGTYEIIGTIGHGSFGIVLKARKLETCELVAIKRIPIKNDQKSDLQIVQEMVALRNSDHENIVKLLDVLKDSSAVSFILELAETNLKSVIDDSSLLLDETVIRGYFYQILRGVAYLHSLSIMHRDLKPGNVLIFTEGILKITDFGQSCYYFQEDPTRSYENQVASRWYRAPELLFGSTHYSPKVDLWSCGCILAELNNRSPLFQGKNDIDQITCIMSVLGSPNEENWKGWDDLPDSNKLLFDKFEPVTDWGKIVHQASSKFTSLLRRLIVYDPETRFSASEALRHEFFSEVVTMDESHLSADCFGFKFVPTVVEYSENNNLRGHFGIY